MGTNLRGEPRPLFTPGGRGYEVVEGPAEVISSSLKGERWWASEEEKRAVLLPPEGHEPGRPTGPDPYDQRVLELQARIAQAQRGG